ncbi:MAG TPA: hypothetical protein VFR97_05865 [Capillimicrobium sp.]|nr:hypothetical protein [Capillimicrobium sp.]
MRTSNRLPSIRAVAGATLAVATVAAAAPAAAPARQATFRVALKGVQTTTWETRHVPMFECDVSIQGSGTETVRFRAKPTEVTVDASGGDVSFRQGFHDATIDLRATIARQGAIETTAQRICADGDGTGGPPPPTPDCGTKRSETWVQLRYASRDVIALQPELAAPLGPFRECPVGGTAWPELLHDVDGRAVGQRLPVDDLFAHGKHIVIATGREEVSGFDETSTTTIRWELSLTRLGGADR